eukprot:4761883-Amphidinium_carterae.6
MVDKLKMLGEFQTTTSSRMKCGQIVIVPKAIHGFRDSAKSWHMHLLRLADFWTENVREPGVFFYRVSHDYTSDVVKEWFFTCRRPWARSKRGLRIIQNVKVEIPEDFWLMPRKLQRTSPLTSSELTAFHGMIGALLLNGRCVLPQLLVDTARFAQVVTKATVEDYLGLIAVAKKWSGQIGEVFIPSLRGHCIANRQRWGGFIPTVPPLSQKYFGPLAGESYACCHVVNLLRCFVIEAMTGAQDVDSCSSCVENFTVQIHTYTDLKSKMVVCHSEMLTIIEIKTFRELLITIAVLRFNCLRCSGDSMKWLSC